MTWVHAAAAGFAVGMLAMLCIYEFFLPEDEG